MDPILEELDHIQLVQNLRWEARFVDKPTIRLIQGFGEMFIIMGILFIVLSVRVLLS